jgi:peptidoglycan/xylan/chitin deacetylase (PgdA/CDA1 family)
MAIAMTFDDGPSSKTTPQLLDILEELNIQVTFFVVGKMVKQNPGVLQKIVKARQGHEICNHSWNHANFKGLEDNNIRSQIEDTQKAIQDAGGGNAASKIVRPPYGSINKRQIDFIQRELGYKVIGWDIDPRDWEGGTNSEQIKRHITTRTKDGQVILLHDIHQRTINAMPETLRTLKQKFTFQSVSRLGNFTRGGIASLIQCGCNIFYG